MLFYSAWLNRIASFSLLALTAGGGLFLNNSWFVANQAQAAAGFSVQGSKIYAPNGSEFVIRGVNINGPNWVWPRKMTQDVDKIANCWKFNLVRVNSLLFDGSPRWKDNDNIDELVKTFTDRKVVVMFEAHDKTGSFYENQDLVKLVNWHKSLASRYKNNPYVWFNVMNEPGAFPSAQDRAKWLKVHQTVIKAIRDEVGASNIIMADGLAWGQDAGDWSAAPIKDNNSATLSHAQSLIKFNGKTYPNIIFSFHAYDQWNQGDSRMANYLDRVLAKKLAIVVGEYGAKHPSLEYQKAVQAVFNTAVPRRVGRIVWHWFGGDEYDLTTTDNGGGYHINSCNNPTNLTWLGQKVWADTHSNLSWLR